MTEGAAAPPSGGGGGDGAAPSSTPAANDNASTETPAVEGEAKPVAEPRRYKLKVDGAEEDVDEDTLIGLAQKGKSADKRFREASEMEKRNQAFIEAIRKDPDAVLEHMGPEAYERAILRAVNSKKPEVQKAAERAFQKLLDDANMPEDEKRRRDLDQREAKLREIEEQREKAEREAQETAAVEAARGEYMRVMPLALKAVALPVTDRTIARLAYFLDASMESEHPLTVEDAAQQVAAEYKGDVAGMLQGLDGDAILALLGDDALKKVRAADLKRVQSQPGRTPAPTAAPRGRTEPAAERRTVAEVFAELRKRR